MTDGAVLCETYGFDRERIDGRMSQFGLSRDHAAVAGLLHRHVLAEHADAMVETFYDRLQGFERAQEILLRGYDIKTLKHAQTEYILSLGQSFWEPAYVGNRLAVGLAHARVGVPLSLYQAAYLILQRILVDGVRRYVPAPQRDAALDFVLAITALDMSLAIETYHGVRMTTLEDSLGEAENAEQILRARMQLDTLTEVASREYALERLDHALRRWERDRTPVCLAMADLDFFKRVNDVHGHLAGDAVLRDVAARMRSAVRDQDVVGRYGGEEFLLLMQGADLATARRVVQRVRERVADAPINLRDVQVAVTISIGLAQAGPGEAAHALIDRADRALYAAKQAGRNRVVMDDAAAGD
jgi:two-component system, cell cycle response regulator